MDPLLPVRRLLEASSDPENPSAEELDAFFRRIRTIAVVGLSRDPMKTARRVPSYLAAKGYDVIAINPHAERILGRDAVPTLSDLSEPVDAVVVFRPSKVAGAFVREAMGLPGEPAIWLQEGIRSDAEVAEARAAGRLVVQDMCAYQVHRAVFS